MNVMSQRTQCIEQINVIANDQARQSWSATATQTVVLARRTIKVIFVHALGRNTKLRHMTLHYVALRCTKLHSTYHDNAEIDITVDFAQLRHRAAERRDDRPDKARNE
jgi:hypothetical protein